MANALFNSSESSKRKYAEKGVACWIIVYVIYEAMQLLVGLRNEWKCVDVQLLDGSTPSVGGLALHDCDLEPARWFKARLDLSLSLQLEIRLI